jgi:hypothetical protein
MKVSNPGAASVVAGAGTGGVPLVPGGGPGGLGGVIDRVA